MVPIEVSSNFLLGVSARHISDHQVGSCFFTRQNLLKVKSSAIVLTLTEVRDEGLLGVFFLELVKMVAAYLLVTIIATDTVA